MKGNILKLKHNLLTDVLEEMQNHKDLRIFCRDGQLSCNGFLFATTFPAFCQMFEPLHYEESSLSLSIPDIDLSDMKNFFRCIYQQKPKIETSVAILHILNWSESPFPRVKTDVSLAPEELIKTEVVEDDGLDDYNDSNIEFKDIINHDTTEYTQIAFKKVATKNEDVDDLADGKSEKTKMGVEKKPRQKTSRKYEAKKYPAFEYKQLYCEVCEMSFKSASGLYTHVYNKHGPHLEQRCDECGMVFPNPAVLTYHKDSKHTEEAPCPHCGKVLTIKSLQAHLRNQHPEDELVSCQECSKTFTNKVKLKTHMRNMHSEHPDKKCLSKKSKGNLAAECDEVCNCGIIFSNLDEKVRHFKIVHKGYEECPKCNKVVLNLNADSDRHICNPNYKRPKPKQVCPLCGKQFSDYSGLFYHRQTVHEAIEVNCELCGKVFQSEVRLQAHIVRTHKEMTACTICGAVVRNMKNHMHAVHTDDSQKSYQCDFCGKGFMDKKGLENHRMSVHLKLRPYNCRYGCDISYNDTSNRNHHEKKKHGALFTK